MAHNVKIKYYARENSKVGTHSFYAQAIPNGTYGFEEICRQASRNTSIEAHTIRAAVEEYIKVAMEKLLDGFRVELGPDFVTLGPGLTAKVKDDVDNDGTVKKVCTADDLTAVGARSRVTAVVNSEFSYEFNRSVRWQKTDKKGNPLEPDEEDATLDDDEAADLQTYALTISKTGTGTATVTSGGNAVASGSSLNEDAEVELSITPATGRTPTATVNGSSIELTESDGTYTGSFTMPAQASTLVINTGTNSSIGDDD